MPAPRPSLLPAGKLLTMPPSPALGVCRGYRREAGIGHPGIWPRSDGSTTSRAPSFRGGYWTRRPPTLQMLLSTSLRWSISRAPGCARVKGCLPAEAEGAASARSSTTPATAGRMAATSFAWCGELGAQRGRRLTVTTRQPWPMPGPLMRSMRVIEQFSIVKASAASGSSPSAKASAARIVPPWATAMMSSPE